MSRPTYLLDTNVLQEYINRTSYFHQWIKTKNKNARIFTCTIVIGEVKAGHQITTTTDVQARRDYENRIRRTIGAQCFDISQSISDQYAAILSSILHKHPRALKANGKPKRSVADHLQKKGVQINDVWIAATALDRNAILVTDDDMSVIKEVTPNLRSERCGSPS